VLTEVKLGTVAAISRVKRGKVRNCGGDNPCAEIQGTHKRP
jgi:hypothetical protein